MREELAEVLADPNVVVVVEWADIVEDILPSRKLTVRIQPTSEEGRAFSFEYPEELQYLIPQEA